MMHLLPEWLARTWASLMVFLASGVLAGDATRLPEFTQTAPAAWINSTPLRREDLLGQVALLDVWTFDCWNCYRSFPWLHEVESRYADRGLRLIGIHSPEFDRERQRDAVVAKVAEFGIGYPVMLDNDFAYWEALGNHYWPAYYLVDRKGMIRASFFGEIHSGDLRGLEIETWIERLLNESG